MAEEKKTGGEKHITGARIAKEIRQYKKDALLSPMYTTLCVVLEILIPYLTASIIDKGIAVGDACRMCGMCVRSCPEGAIRFEQRANAVDKSKWSDFLVYVEQERGDIHQ